MAQATETQTNSIGYNAVAGGVVALGACAKQLIRRGELTQAEKNVATAYELVKQYEASMKMLNWETDSIDEQVRKLRIHIGEIEDTINKEWKKLGAGD